MSGREFNRYCLKKDFCDLWNNLSDSILKRKTIKPIPMKLILLKNDDLKEIIFENRNKLYGAYQLRSNYNRTLNRSMLIALFSLVILATFFIFVHRFKNDLKKPDIVKTTPYEFQNFVIETYSAAKSEPLSSGATKKAAPLDNTYQVVEKPDPLATIHSTTTHTQIDNGQGNENGSSLANNNTNNTNGSETSSANTTPRELVSVEKAPAFPGGIEKFYSYLLNRLHFTPDAREAKLASRFFITFIIGADGKINSVTIPNQIGYGMDELVIKILNESPVWTPGLYQGQPVSTIIRLPINFRMAQ